MQKPVVLVTGSNGQVGKELQQLAASYPQFRFVFATREDLPLHHFGLAENFFIGIHPQYCINCAAYTAVDKAESEPELARLVNGEAVGHLAALCRKYQTKLIHISTDYVFDGNQERPYVETDPTGPMSVYGRTKLLGEELCQKELPDAMIIRTAWVYSEFGNNFVKTMIRLMKDRMELNVVNDQIGAPTYAADLAKAILEILVSAKWIPGIYHYSNAGKISWYDFALKIKAFIGSSCVIHPIPTSQYPTPAKRPHFSLLNTSRITKEYGLQTYPWDERLGVCIKQLNSRQN